jgi:hypothetical protein
MTEVINYVSKVASDLGLNEWTKKLGQQHFNVPNEPTTLCGMPMLGNNYARVYSDTDKTPCPKCEEALVLRADSMYSSALPASDAQEWWG